MEFVIQIYFHYKIWNGIIIPKFAVRNYLVIYRHGCLTLVFMGCKFRDANLSTEKQIEMLVIEAITTILK